jgi:uncharacterized protein with von Willebrand factor type A (vWA) domain
MALDQLEVANRQVEEWIERRPEWPLLAREVFARLYTGDEIPEVRKPAKWAQRVHDQASELPEFRRLLDLCQDDRLESGAAAIAVARTLEEVIPPEQTQDMGSDEEDGDGQGDGSGGAGGGPQPPDTGPDGGGGQPPSEDEQNQDGPDGGQDEVEDGAIRQAIRDACQEVADEADQRRSAMAALGVGWGDEVAQHGVRANHDQLVALAERLRTDRRLLEIAELAGRVEAIARAKQVDKARRTGAEIVDVTLGSDPARLLPTELALMRRRPTRLDLLRRMTSGAALVYEVQGDIECGKGPIVMCLDVSGSMSGARDMWSKAIALGLRNVAAREGRDAHIILFDHNIVAEYTEDGDIVAMLNVIDTFTGGGTNWEAVLNRARELIDGTDGTWAEADIVLVTDGECGVSQSWAEQWDAWREETRVSCLGILIAEGYRYRYRGEEDARTLARICNTVTQVKPEHDKVRAAEAVIEVAV